MLRDGRKPPNAPATRPSLPTSEKPSLWQQAVDGDLETGDDICSAGLSDTMAAAARARHGRLGGFPTMRLRRKSRFLRRTAEPPPEEFEQFGKIARIATKSDDRGEQTSVNCQNVCGGLLPRDLRAARPRQPRSLPPLLRGEGLASSSPRAGAAEDMLDGSAGLRTTSEEFPQSGKVAEGRDMMSASVVEVQTDAVAAPVQRVLVLQRVDGGGVDLNNWRRVVNKKTMSTEERYQAHLRHRFPGVLDDSPLCASLPATRHR
eukprot:TRINITY_DN28843_c0_g1_i1.p1 TRINITY_DN28843_c0_g1~~TRINITY_DN28843_c0_g1_i1.p1  ORF type:complete len:261 (-),score=29.19 TRINITY_DN28843_c0_g1_i1:168-950(-)